ncbi:MAG: DUF4142 domain-containing protein [Gemmatimonadales bacterium]|nr:DUF4142 domain-containing protein [Gemmatimonadales bacterium]
MAGRQVGPVALAGLALGMMAMSASSLQAQGKADVKADSMFLQEAAMGGKMEVQLGKLAAEKASNPQVKQFGSQMVRDHGKANMKLKAVARQGGMTPPDTLPAEKQQDVDKLSSMSGKDFDTAYIGMMVKAHNEDVQKFTDESHSAKSTAVRQFASQTLPTLKRHQMKVKRIAGQIGADTTGTGMSMGQGSTDSVGMGSAKMGTDSMHQSSTGQPSMDSGPAESAKMGKDSMGKDSTSR